MDFVLAMIGHAPQAAGLLPTADAWIMLNEIDLTLNVAAVHDEDGNLKFSVFGLDGDLGRVAPGRRYSRSRSDSSRRTSRAAAPTVAFGLHVEEVSPRLTASAIRGSNAWRPVQ